MSLERLFWVLISATGMFVAAVGRSGRGAAVHDLIYLSGIERLAGVKSAVEASMKTAITHGGVVRRSRRRPSVFAAHNHRKVRRCVRCAADSTGSADTLSLINVCSCALK
jgi:hypothetical protein